MHGSDSDVRARHFREDFAQSGATADGTAVTCAALAERARIRGSARGQYKRCPLAGLCVDLSPRLLVRLLTRSTVHFPASSFTSTLPWSQPWPRHARCARPMLLPPPPSYSLLRRRQGHRHRRHPRIVSLIRIFAHLAAIDRTSTRPRADHTAEYSRRKRYARSPIGGPCYDSGARPGSAGSNIQPERARPQPPRVCPRLASQTALDLKLPTFSSPREGPNPRSGFNRDRSSAPRLPCRDLAEESRFLQAGWTQS
ncbi:hypothetical protein PsYK624_070280 [Phanerochaete sordida]|uniref:Uncharacterized protein n=1 Tax=Phanerochaete sordida TaxID=48140 RepID=A0A9P3GAN4_9APHY|nr:hypothetical protein PsYK624_070280 [Phanerochaete sordida]